MIRIHSQLAQEVYFSKEIPALPPSTVYVAAGFAFWVNRWVRVRSDELRPRLCLNWGETLHALATCFPSSNSGCYCALADSQWHVRTLYVVSKN